MAVGSRGRNETAAERGLGAFRVTLDVTFRPCREGDLTNLEWFGWFQRHREIIRTAFLRQQAGEVAMIVAESARFPVGQVWVDLTKRAGDSAGLLWALRVLPGLQVAGIGSRLVRAAEGVIRGQGLSWSEVGVEKADDVRPFYDRLGYHVVGEIAEQCVYTTPDGQRRCDRIEQWVMRKRLDGEPAG